MMSWRDRFRTVKTIDAHTGGEPLRLILDGLPPLKGSTVLEKRAYMRCELDHYRTALMFEPRGHADMYGCVLTEPDTADGDYGVIFLHNEGYSTMCGHGVIALVTILLETGMTTQTVLKLDTPAGRVTATACLNEGRVESVSFLNVPSFVERTGVFVNGASYDIAFGGAYYAIGDATVEGSTNFLRSFGLPLEPAGVERLIAEGRRVKAEIGHDMRHPYEPDLSFLYGVIFTGPPYDPSNHSRNVCIFADGEVDRSPTGTGVSARAALHYFRGDIGLREPIVIESILGSTFTVEVVEEVEFGGRPAVIPRVTGSAHITGMSEFLIDPADPLGHGFLIR